MFYFASLYFLSLSWNYALQFKNMLDTFDYMWIVNFLFQRESEEKTVILRQRYIQDLWSRISFYWSLLSLLIARDIHIHIWTSNFEFHFQKTTDRILHLCVEWDTNLLSLFLWIKWDKFVKMLTNCKVSCKYY